MTQLGGFQQQPNCWKQLCSVRQSSGESVSWKEARLGGDSVVLRSRYSPGVVAVTPESPFWPSAVALLASLWVVTGPEGSGEPSESTFHPAFSFTW